MPPLISDGREGALARDENLPCQIRLSDLLLIIFLDNIQCSKFSRLMHQIRINNCRNNKFIQTKINEKKIVTVFLK